MHDLEGGNVTISGQGRRRRRVVGAALLAVVLGVGAVACSSDSSDEGTSSTTGATADDGTEETSEGENADDTDEGDTGDETALTAEDICQMLPTEAVAEATGLEVTGATPSEGSTPQCAYSYPSENGPDSNLTVAASRYTSSDAQSIEQAYDSAVDINITTAGGTDVEQTEVDAGDEAIILSGVALELGVLRVGNVLVSLIVPPDTMTSDQTEALMVALGDAFS